MGDQDDGDLSRSLLTENRTQACRGAASSPVVGSRGGAPGGDEGSRQSYALSLPARVRAVWSVREGAKLERSATLAKASAVRATREPRQVRCSGVR